MLSFQAKMMFSSQLGLTNLFFLVKKYKKSIKKDDKIKKKKQFLCQFLKKKLSFFSEKTRKKGRKNQFLRNFVWNKKV